jgi:hypothetical protein
MRTHLWRQKRRINSVHVDHFSTKTCLKTSIILMGVALLPLDNGVGFSDGMLA